ncbi:MAG: hypothetical protein ACO1PB_06045 [Ramlibacter sp.]
MPRSLLSTVLALAAAAPSLASDLPEPQPLRHEHEIAILGGQGVDLNLRQVPRAIATGEWRREPSRFTGLSYAHVRNTLGGSIRELRGTPLMNVQHGYEILLLQHRGLQDNAEVAATYFVRTPALEVSVLRVNFGAGGGLSHAFGTPTYEDGPRSDPTRRYRTQFAGFLEFEWSAAPWPAVALVTRVQHRSGIYGLIAPRHVGSNFVSAGLRYKF